MKSYWDKKKKPIHEIPDTPEKARAATVIKKRNDLFIEELQEKLMKRLGEDTFENIMLEYKREILDYAHKECDGKKCDMATFLGMVRTNINYIQAQIAKVLPSKTLRMVITMNIRQNFYFIPLGEEFMFKSLNEARDYFEKIGRIDWSPVRLAYNMADIIYFKEKKWNEETSYEDNQAHR